MENKNISYKYNPENPLLVGGQAVIEGVMMKAPNAIATAVRRANGEIEIKKEPFISISSKYPLLKTPFLRGIVNFIEMMIIGIKTLNYSADIALQDSDYDDKRKDNKKNYSNFTTAITLIIAFLIGMVVFFVFPLFVTTKLFHFENNILVFNLVTGFFRLLLFLLYVFIISKMKDIYRIFQYHGAEHKLVFTFEEGKELTVDNAKKFTTFHPRCGTSFLVVVFIVAIISFALLDAIIISKLGYINLPIRLLVHLPFIPFLGGISYEFIRLSAKKSDSFLGKMLALPGLWLQRITTKEPDENQLEVALCALKSALEYSFELENKK